MRNVTTARQKADCGAVYGRPRNSLTLNALQKVIFYRVKGGLLACKR